MKVLFELMKCIKDQLTRAKHASRSARLVFMMRQLKKMEPDHNTRAALWKAYTKKYVGIVRIGVRVSGVAILTTKYTLLTSIPHNIVFVPTYLTFHENF